MQLSSLFIAAVSAATLVSAQNVPSCAYQCVTQMQRDVANTGCGGLSQQNKNCLCAHRKSFQPSIDCVNKACPANDAKQAINMALGMC